VSLDIPPLLLSVLAETEPAALTPARWQMALSLGFHIVLACFGVAFPAMIYAAHRRGLRRDDPVALGLAQRWAKVAAVLFAVGAVSGTILAFEMGLLWPELMRTYGDVIGLPFALEGIAFFLEAIFIGIYLVGWNRLPGRLHLAMLWPIMISGAVGTFMILSVNAWMNNPAGFAVVDGEVVDIDPWGAMLNDAVWVMFLHMWVATFVVAGFVTAAVYATGLLRGRNDRHHRLGFTIAFLFGAGAALFQPVIGHFAGERVVEAQPSKMAAMELAPSTEGPAPLALGGVMIDGERRFAIEIPRLGSLLAHGDLSSPITGLDEFPEDERPDDRLATIVHLSFQGMVGIGLALVALGAAYALMRRRGRNPLTRRWFLRATVLAGPLSVLALQLGWITTEVGRQPWIVYEVMRIEEAVTTGSGVWVSVGILIALYVALGIGTVVVLRSMARRWREGAPLDLPTPYSPSVLTASVGTPTSDSAADAIEVATEAPTDGKVTD
jgi:cytochrome bd ubiquinol oxidase subunit I